MGNKFYESGPDRAQRVQDLFARIARRYDLINDLQSFGLHRVWKRRMVRMARLGPQMRALDLCCGTGDVSFAMAETGAMVVGADFSQPMLDVAAQRKQAKTGSIVFVQGDAMNLEFRDATFEAVASAYGLRNLAEWRVGLAEMVRVATPGGRILVLDFGRPENRLWRSVYFAYLAWAVPIFGRLFCGDAATHAYILESLRHYPAQLGVAAAMKELGCRDVQIVNLVGGAMSINLGIKG